MERSSLEQDGVRFTRRDGLVLLGLVLLALLVRLAFFRGVYAFDDFNYLRHAAEVWKGRFDLGGIEYWHGLRFLIFVPIAGVFAAFGVSESTAVAWPLLVSLATVALVYRIGFDVHSRTAGVVASALVALSPMLVDESTRVLPGPIINGLMAASVLCFVHAERGARRPGVWLFFSGAFFAYMPWSGHLGLVFGLFFPAVLLFRRYPLRRYWPLALGLAGIVFIATFHQWAASRDPFANFAVSSSVLANEVATPKPFFYFWMLVKPLASHGGTLYLALLGAWAAFRFRSTPARWLLLWLVLTYVAIEFGSSSLTSYRPLFKQARYLTVLAVPGMLLAGVGVAECWRHRPGWLPARLASVLGLLGAVVIILGSLETLTRRTSWSADTRRELAAVRSIVREYDGQVIYTVHWLWNTRVGFFLDFADAYFPSGYTPYHAVRVERADFESKNRYVQLLRPGDVLEPGLVLVDDVLLAHTIGERRIPLVGPGEIPPQLLTPPENWRLVARHASLSMYDVRGGTWPAAP